MLTNLYTAIVSRKELEKEVETIITECNENLYIVGVTITGKVENGLLIIECYNPHGSLQGREKAVIITEGTIPKLSYGYKNRIISQWSPSLKLVIDEMIGKLLMRAFYIGDSEYLGTLMTKELHDNVASKIKELKGNIKSFCRYAKKNGMLINSIDVEDKAVKVDMSVRMTNAKYVLAIEFNPLKHEKKYDCILEDKDYRIVEKSFKTLAEAIHHAEQKIVHHAFN